MGDKNHKGQEISGYIDYGHRLKIEEFEPYFTRKKRLLPRPSDLSFYNWDTQHSTSNESPNFQINPDHEQGLLFKNKRDRKVINVDPKVEPGDNSKRHDIKTTEYIQVVIFDHMTRKKSKTHLVMLGYYLVLPTDAVMTLRLARVRCFMS